MKCPIVQDLETNLIEIRDFVFIELLRVGHHVKHVGVFRTQRGREDAFVGIPEIPCCDGFAIGPLGVAPKVEGVNRSARRNIPTLRDTGNRMKIMRVFRDQSFEQRHDNVMFGHTGDDLWIEFLWLGAVALVKNLLAVTAFHASLALTTSCEEQQSKNEC